MTTSLQRFTLTDYLATSAAGEQRMELEQGRLTSDYPCFAVACGRCLARVRRVSRNQV